jgi:CubicO group peptidase (beta-lactamase class C family)
MQIRRRKKDRTLARSLHVVERSIGEVCTAAVVHVRKDGHVVGEAAFGLLVPGAASVSADSIFDLASITKIYVGTALLALHDRRRLALDDRIVSVIPEFAGPDSRRGQVTYRHLLTHTSGLPAHVNFRDELGAKAVIARVCNTPLTAAPAANVVYSDLGFMLAGEAVARIAKAPLDEALRELVLESAECADTCYLPPASDLGRIVCTERDSWRGRLLRGEVHDENCWAMGGIAGHAGLFGTAADTARLAEAYRLGGALGSQRTLQRSTARAAVRQQAVGTDERRGLGWALRASDRHSSGSRLSFESYGHTGYTGTSVWVDPIRALTVVLFTNRVFMTREPEPIRDLRAALHDAVVADLS